MKQEIIGDLDALIGILTEIRDAIKEGKDLEQIDALDTLAFASIGLESVYNKINTNLSLTGE